MRPIGVSVLRQQMETHRGKADGRCHDLKRRVLGVGLRKAPAGGEDEIGLGARGRTDVPRIVDWYMENKINIDDLITHTMPLEDINKGFDLMKCGESIRGVVLY
jgi:hypothetical protein